MLFRDHKSLGVVVVLILALVMGAYEVIPAQASVGKYQIGSVYRVAPGGATSGSCGADWLNPCDLQYALTLASSGAELWVKQGTYQPGTTDRNSTFMLKNGVTVYGGFDGTETLLSQRNPDPSTNNTVLSGDIGTVGDITDNTYHVVTANYVSSTAILDGFTITNGNANGGTGNFGGGMYLTNSTLTLNNLIFINNSAGNAGSGGGLYVSGNSSPTLTNIDFNGNSASNGGGGMYIQNSTPTLTDVNFIGNSASVTGGGLSVKDSTPTLINVNFTGNSSSSEGGGMTNTNSASILTNVTFTNNSVAGGPGGGMIINFSNPVLTNVTFSNNTVTGGGGGVYNYFSNPTMSNVTFSDNSAGRRGGGMVNEGSNPTLTNVTFSGNTASETVGVTPKGGGALFNLDSNPILNNTTFAGNISPTADAMSNSGTSLPQVSNSIFWDNTTNEFSNIDTSGINIVDSVVQGGCPAGGTCTNVISANPNLSALANNSGFTQTRALGTGSSAINTGGVNSICSLTDQRGVTRPQGSGCDIGSYEAYLLTITADPQTMTYGDVEPAFSFQYSGFIGGDTAAVINTPPTCGVSGAHANVGSYTITCSGGLDDKYVFFAYVDDTLTVNKATPTLSVANSPVFYDGLLHAATITSPVSGIVSNVLTGGSASQTNAGTYPVIADFTPTDTFNYNSLVGVSVGNFIINKVTPTLSVTNSPVLYDGSPHAATVTTPVSGTVGNVLTGGSATQTNAGTYAVTADFTPTDTANYNSLAGVSVGDFIINKITPTLSVTNSPVLYTGSSHAATVTSPVLGTVSNILMGGSASQTNAGTYAVTADFTPIDTVNYNTLVGASAGDFIINKITPTLSVTNSPVLYDNSPHAATVSSSVPGTVSNILTGGSVTQTNIGNYAVTADFTPTDTVNYNSLVGASAGNFVISPDITPPDTQIIIRPASPSSASVTFSFSSADGTATFECQMDGSGFAACTSPKNYTGLANGPHTFEVRAKDPADNIDATPASHTWIVAVSTIKSMESKIVVPSSLTSQDGSTNGSTPSLGFLEQSGIDDSPSAYVNFQTPASVYVGYQSFYLPSDIQPALISSVLLQVNFKGPAAPAQTWTWSIYDWNSGLWIKVGDTIGAGVDQWQTLTFSIRNIQRYISPSRELRIQLRSNNVNGDVKIDYEALHITYRSTTIAPTPTAPSVPAHRPGISSVPQ